MNVHVRRAELVDVEPHVPVPCVPAAPRHVIAVDRRGLLKREWGGEGGGGGALDQVLVLILVAPHIKLKAGCRCEEEHHGDGEGVDREEGCDNGGV